MPFYPRFLNYTLAHCLHMKKVLSIALLAALAACSSETTKEDPNYLLGNDFDNLESWLPATPSLTRDVAHSGKYSVKVDGDNEYALGFNNQLGKISSSRLKKIKLQGWAYMVSNRSAARLQLQIVDPATNKEIFSDGINLADQVKGYRNWTKISKEITLPDNVASNQTLKVYLWRGAAGDTAYLDDLQVVREE